MSTQYHEIPVGIDSFTNLRIERPQQKQKQSTYQRSMKLLVAAALLLMVVLGVGMVVLPTLWAM